MDYPFNQKATVGDEVGLDFGPDDIHVMRLGETEDEFDKRIESYEEARYAV